MAEPRMVRLRVNGTQHSANVEPRVTLADFLRGELGFGGVHLGCEHGVCGACTILLDGRAARSCIMLAVQADGVEIVTIEGLSNDVRLHPIQEAFKEAHGLQCGFCTPGFIMSIHELLAENPSPGDEEIRETLGGNLCRCTGYQSIIEAVHIAARKLREAPAGGG